MISFDEKKFRNRHPIEREFHYSEGYYKYSLSIDGKRRYSVFLAVLKTDLIEATHIFGDKSRAPGKPPLKEQLKKVTYNIFCPHTGTQLEPEIYTEVLKNTKKVEDFEAKCLWKAHHEYSGEKCGHMFWEGYCDEEDVCDVS